jgi:hypothetical protein
MITQYTPVEKQIEFYENKINQYLDVIKINTKGDESCRLWIEWIAEWNREITELKKTIDKETI